MTGKCAMQPVAANTVFCNDDNPCTAEGYCDGKGSCAVGVSLCGCVKDSDCKAKEDGDLCNGTLYCEVKSGKCEINPASVVTCSTANDTQCVRTLCDITTGQCLTVPKEKTKLVVQGCLGENCKYTLNGPQDKVNPAACEDGDSCTAGDVCAAGVCKADKNICGCAVDADCKAKEDGDFCNGTLACFNKQCVVLLNSIVNCPTGGDSQCARTVCDPSDGLCKKLPVEATVAKKQGCDPSLELFEFIPKLPGAPTTVNVECSDQNACTAFDTCLNGQCISGTNTCLCTQDADCANQEDGNVCNGTLYCDKSENPPKCTVNPATVVTCPSAFDTACSVNLCEAKTGKCAFKAINEFGVCNDNNACTKDDGCSGGQCLGGVNSCNCKAKSDCDGYEDGNACNGTLVCTPSGLCALDPTTVKYCPSAQDSICVKNTCNVTSGKCEMIPTFAFTPCTDGNPCTHLDMCEAGKCAPGTNVCTCAKDGDCADKEDGILCNGTLYCDKASFGCKVNPGTVIVCDNGSQSCQLNKCEALTGKCYVELADGQCNDVNPCTIDTCLDGGKCSYKNAGDDVVCAVGKVCKSGFCVSK